MALDEADRRFACQLVYARSWRVRTICEYDLERMGKIVDSSWKSCGEKVTGEKFTGELASLENYCLSSLEMQPDYKDIVSFIPVWLIGMMLKLIISILIDFWLTHEGKK